MKQVDSLRRQNSLLKSELLDISKAYRVAKKELTGLKIFYSKNHLKIDVNRNTKKSVPFSGGIGRCLDLRLKEQDRPGVNKMFNLSELKYSDVKLGLCNQTKHLNLERLKNVLNVEKELYGTDSLKQPPSPLKKLLQNIRILQGSKNTLDSKHGNETCGREANESEVTFRAAFVP